MKNFGFIEDVVELGAYVLGDPRVPNIQLVPSGDWEKYLPKYEAQADEYETSGCTVWGWQNGVETFIKGVYGYEPNYSERFNYVLAGVKPDGGANPSKVAQSIRDYGLIDNTLFPMPKTLLEFVDPLALTNDMRREGENWLKRHDFTYALVWKDERPENYMDVLKEQLQRSPLVVSVSAWRKQVDANGYVVYTSDKGGNNHCCVLYQFDEDGYPWVFDSYDHSKKRLAKDHNIRRAFVFHIQDRSLGGLMKYVRLLKQLINAFRNKKSMLSPLEREYRVTQKFGVSNNHYISGVHNGTDYACPVGTPLLAPADGEIIHRFTDHPSLGNAIHYSCDGYYIRFLHLLKSLPKGKYKQGDIIGYTGNTGDSEGPHLHVDVWKVPINTGLIKTRSGVFNNLVDPELFFNNNV